MSSKSNDSSIKDFLKCSLPGKSTENFFVALNELIRIEGVVPPGLTENIRNTIVENMFYTSIANDTELIKLIQERIDYLMPSDYNQIINEEQLPSNQIYDVRLQQQRKKLQVILQTLIRYKKYNQLDLKIAELLKTKLGVLIRMLNTGISRDIDVIRDVTVKDYIINMFLEDAYADKPEFYMASIIFNRSIYVFKKNSNEEPIYYQNVIPNGKLPIYLLRYENGNFKLLLPNILSDIPETCSIEDINSNTEDDEDEDEDGDEDEDEDLSLILDSPLHISNDDQKNDIDQDLDLESEPELNLEPELEQEEEEEEEEEEDEDLTPLQNKQKIVSTIKQISTPKIIIKPIKPILPVKKQNITSSPKQMKQSEQSERQDSHQDYISEEELEELVDTDLLEKMVASEALRRRLIQNQ